MDVGECVASSTITQAACGVLQSGDCHVCKETRGLQSVLHVCKFCGLLVCAAHSRRRRALSEQVALARICDKCHKDIIGAGVKGEKKAALKCLRKQLQADQSKYALKTTDLGLKSDQLTTLRTHLAAQQTHKAGVEAEFSDRLREARQRTEEKRKEVREKEEMVLALRQKVRAKEEELSTKQAEITIVKREIAQLSGQIPDMEQSLAQATLRVQRQMNKSDAIRIFCPACNPKFQHMMVGAEAQRESRKVPRAPGSDVCKKCACM